MRAGQGQYDHQVGAEGAGADDERILVDMHEFTGSGCLIPDLPGLAREAGRPMCSSNDMLSRLINRTTEGHEDLRWMKVSV